MRDVRLAALQEAPDAFGSTYAREAPFTREQWLARISDRNVNYLAYVEAAPEPAAAEVPESVTEGPTAEVTEQAPADPADTPQENA